MPCQITPFQSTPFCTTTPFQTKPVQTTQYKTPSGCQGQCRLVWEPCNFAVDGTHRLTWSCLLHPLPLGWQRQRGCQPRQRSSLLLARGPIAVTSMRTVSVPHAQRLEAWLSSSCAEAGHLASELAATRSWRDTAATHAVVGSGSLRALVCVWARMCENPSCVHPTAHPPPPTLTNTPFSACASCQAALPLQPCLERPLPRPSPSHCSELLPARPRAHHLD